MATEPENLLFIMSDEQSGKYTGFGGHPIVKTPNLDALATSGTVFSNAYTNSPICKSARAALSTGRYVHETGHWCNAHPYTGTPGSWMHRLQDAHIPVTSIGKLHFSDDKVPTGFDQQVIPMHAVNGVGDILGAIRDGDLPVRHKTKSLAEEIGPGESAYTKYDRDITKRASEWLEQTSRGLSQPWVLYVGLVAPHFPLIAPEEFYNLYNPDDMPLPKRNALDDPHIHPWLQKLKTSYITDQFFTDETRRMAIASYFGLCSYLDDNVGKILKALDQSGQKNRTRIIYASDHGDNLGARGVWQKNNCYEESAKIPLIMSGHGIQANTRVETPVSLIDIYPTILEATGVTPVAEDQHLPGRSLIDLAIKQDDPERMVLSEYHGAGAASALFMLRKNQYKYLHYHGYAPELFDLDSDPEELNDLAADPNFSAVISEFDRELRNILDPEQIDQRAKTDQRKLIDQYGGREKVLSKGGFGATPPPGVKPSYG